MCTIRAWIGVAALATTLDAAAQTPARPDRLGDALQWAVPLAAGSYALYRDDREGLVQLGIAWSSATLGTEALKRAVHDPRPSGAGHGFASGHTASTFAAAGFLHQRYGLAVSVPAYALATATAYSRVHTGNHSTRQVLLGAGVGVGSAAVFTKQFGPDQRAAVVATVGGWVISYESRF